MSPDLTALRTAPRRLAMALLLGCALLIGLALPAAAREPLPGRDNPAFAAALADWLADDEARALPALAALAAEGNGAARVLLGLIDRTPSMQGPFVAQLSREARIALLRAPGGMSGRNWLSLARDIPLAEAFLSLGEVTAGAAILERFAQLGEARAAREALVVLAAREHPELAALDPAAVDPELLYLLWRIAEPERRADIAARVPPRHPQRALMGEQADARDLDDWLATRAAAAPLGTLCAALCPQAQATCRSAAYRALNSHNALLTLGTPAEALVSQAEFLGSPRGQATVLRRLLLAAPIRGRRAALARVAETSECLGAALAADYDRYRTRPRPAAEGTTP